MARLWRHVGILSIAMGLQIVGLLIAGVLLSAPFFIIGAFFLSFGLLINLIPMSGRAWGHLLSADISGQEVQLRYMLGARTIEQRIPRSELQVKAGSLWSRGPRRWKLTLSRNDAPLLTQCSSRSWSNDQLKALYAALEA